jgi:hypothetical protein
MSEGTVAKFNEHNAGRYSGEASSNPLGPPAQCEAKLFEYHGAGIHSVAYQIKCGGIFPGLRKVRLEVWTGAFGLEGAGIDIEEEFVESDDRPLNAQLDRANDREHAIREGLLYAQRLWSGEAQDHRTFVIERFLQAWGDGAFDDPMKVLPHIEAMRKALAQTEG